VELIEEGINKKNPPLNINIQLKMGRQRNRENVLASNLPQLQNLIKRDRDSYVTEFQLQLQHLQSQLQIVSRAPHLPPHKSLPELLSFISHTVPCYQGKSAEADKVPALLISLLEESGMLLHPDLRKSVVCALILLHNRQMVDSFTLIPLFFNLFRCKDKALRETIYSFIIQDIKTANYKHKNNKLNKTTQNLLYSILTPPAGYTPVSSGVANASTSTVVESSGFSPIAAHKALQVSIELYKKHIWNDAKTVNVIVEACFSPIPKIMTTAIHFFLDADKLDKDPDDDSDDETPAAPDVHRAQHQAKINRKSRANTRKLKKILVAQKKSNKVKDVPSSHLQFSALQMIYDPQAFAEKLFSLVKNGQFVFETKLLLINLISRLIASHKLFLLSFYSYMQKYFQPHQRNVTSLLAYCAQASHELVPPDVLYPVIRVIADQFVSENSSREVITAGLNAIREVCTRAPLAMEADLLSDLVQYKSHRDKSVIMAARSLIGLYREVNPLMLPKGDRGKVVSMQLHAGDGPNVEFGHVHAAQRVEGAELLEEDGEEEMIDDDDDAAWNGWEVASDADSSDGEWLEFPDTGIELSDFSESSDVDEAEDSDHGDEPESSEIVEDCDEELSGAEGEEFQDGSEEDSLDGDLESDVSDMEECDDDQETEEKPSRTASDLPIEARKFLTPADFAKMAQLKASAVSDAKDTKRKRFAPSQGTSEMMSQRTEFVDEDSLVPIRKKPKSDYEERIASIASGREGREKYGSRKGKKENGQSTSNLQKLKTKNFTMVSKSRRVSSKRRLSLKDKQRTLRKHISKQKMGK
jgi:protein SDA1